MDTVKVATQEIDKAIRDKYFIVHKIYFRGILRRLPLCTLYTRGRLLRHNYHFYRDRPLIAMLFHIRKKPRTEPAHFPNNVDSNYNNMLKCTFMDCGV